MSPSTAIGVAILLPLLGAIGIQLTGSKPNLREAVTIITSLLTFAVVITLFPVVTGLGPGNRPELELLTVLPGVALAFQVEPLGMLYALVASGLWIPTGLYAIGYCRGHDEQNQTRFFTCFALAIFAALGIAFSRNLFTLFLFYEVLTLSTYPLVTHYGNDEAKAAGRTYLGILLTTSVLFLLMAILWTWNLTGTLEFKLGGILAGKAEGPAVAMLLALFLDRLLDDRGWLPRLAAVVAIGLHLVAVSDLYADQQQLRKLMTYKYDRPTPEYFPTNPASPASDLDNARSWQDTEFWDESSPTLLHILTTDAFDYHVWIPLIGLLGLLALGLFIATKTRRVALVALGLVASMLTVWSLNYYMPSLSPHWSQKYLFDTYYDSCTRDVNPEEVDDAYTPLLARVGLEAVARSFGWEGKVVCKEDVLSWRITWRGETYYSYNELKPITKEANQFLPYLEEMNHGEAFYVLMERGKSKTDGFKNKLTTYSEKLRRKGVAGWEDIDNWQVDILDASSVYFQMVKATPIRST